LEIKEQQDGCGGRVLLGDYTDGGGMILFPVSFQCAEVRFSTGLSCNSYTHIAVYFPLTPDLVERKFCIIPVASVDPNMLQ
jgi:hypothetical protein